MPNFDEPIDGFELPEDCRIDRVAIYPRDPPADPPFVAIPYIHDEEALGGVFREPVEYEPTDRFREAVADRADVPAEYIKLKHEIPTHRINPL